jgi:putative phosphoesterase
MKIGLVSDTHNFLDPRVPPLLAGATAIIHAGDIGLPRILGELERIAPVVAVGGNTDDPAFRYAATRTAEWNGWKVLVRHIVNPHEPDAALSRLLRLEKAAIVVFGHTHKASMDHVGGTWFINPGSAGKRRFGGDCSLALLDLAGREPQVKFHKW